MKKIRCAIYTRKSAEEGLEQRAVGRRLGMSWLSEFWHRTGTEASRLRQV